MSDDFGGGTTRSFIDGIVMAVLGYVIFGVIAIFAVVAFKAWQYFSDDTV